MHRPGRHVELVGVNVSPDSIAIALQLAQQRLVERVDAVVLAEREVGVDGPSRSTRARRSSAVIRDPVAALAGERGVLEVLGADADDHAAVGLGDATAGVASVVERDRRQRELQRRRSAISPGRKFIDGEPMKPATNTLSGWS